MTLFITLLFIYFCYLIFFSFNFKVCIYSLSPDRDDIQGEKHHHVEKSSTLSNSHNHSNNDNQTENSSIPIGNSTVDKSSFKVERFECGEENRPIIILSHEDESS